VPTVVAVTCPPPAATTEPLASPVSDGGEARAGPSDDGNAAHARAPAAAVRATAAAPPPPPPPAVVADVQDVPVHAPSPVAPVAPLPAPPAAPPAAPCTTTVASGTFASGSGQQHGHSALPAAVLGIEIAVPTAAAAELRWVDVPAAVVGGADDPGSSPD
jgi:hypothetical protein